MRRIDSTINFIIGSKCFFLLGPLRLSQTGENPLEPCQNYRQRVAVPPNEFPPMFLLSQLRYADARCHGGDRQTLLTDQARRFERKAGPTRSLRSFK